MSYDAVTWFDGGTEELKILSYRSERAFISDFRHVRLKKMAFGSGVGGNALCGKRRKKEQLSKVCFFWGGELFCFVLFCFLTQQHKLPSELS